MSRSGHSHETTGEDLLADPVIAASLLEIARMEYQLEAIQAQKRQDAMDAELREGVFRDGMGGCERRVDAFAFHQWGHDEGYGCWSDRGFLKYFDRIAPETRVRSRSAKIQVGYQASPGFQVEVRVNAPRFSKSYGGGSTGDSPVPAGGSPDGPAASPPNTATKCRRASGPPEQASRLCYP